MATPAPVAEGRPAATIHEGHTPVAGATPPLPSMLPANALKYGTGPPTANHPTATAIAPPYIPYCAPSSADTTATPPPPQCVAAPLRG